MKDEGRQGTGKHAHAPNRRWLRGAQGCQVTSSLCFVENHAVSFILFFILHPSSFILFL
jgi:hypothetical protein